MGQAQTARSDTINPLALKAVSHPTRLEALRILECKGTASPAQIARELGEPVSKVSPHVRVLEECGYVEEVDQRQVRGAVEHFFRATERSNVVAEVQRQMPRELREQISDTILSNIFTYIERALGGKTFDSRNDRHLAFMAMTLDEKGWEELMVLKDRTLDREKEIEAAAAGRMVEEGTEGFPVCSVDMGFELPHQCEASH